MIKCEFSDLSNLLRIRKLRLINSTIAHKLDRNSVCFRWSIDVNWVDRSVVLHNSHFPSYIKYTDRYDKVNHTTMYREHLSYISFACCFNRIQNKWAEFKRVFECTIQAMTNRHASVFVYCLHFATVRERHRSERCFYLSVRYLCCLITFIAAKSMCLPEKLLSFFHF